MKAPPKSVNCRLSGWFTGRERLLDSLFPSSCRLCGAWRQPEGLCPPCREDLPWLGTCCPCCAGPLSSADAALPCGRCQRRPPAFDHAEALFHYQPPVDFLVKRLKFSGELNLARVFGHLLAERLALRGTALPQQLIPVPLHPTRLRERGFNQATELARSIGRRLALPVCTRLCRRDRATQPQSQLPATARRLNLRHAFSVRTTPAAHVAIVDDVLTTGHTANELARVLKRSGARCVEVWLIARAGA